MMHIIGAVVVVGVLLALSPLKNIREEYPSYHQRTMKL